jgi:hypothetical protein
VVDAALSRPTELAKATTVMSSGDAASVNVTVIDAVVPVTELSMVASDTAELSDAFRTCTALTPAATVYVMLAVYNPALTTVYTGSLVFTGMANCFSNVCDADAALSRPTELPDATTTTLNGDSASVNGTVIVTAVPLKMEVAPEIWVLSDAFRTCTWVTSASTVYVMLAV